MKKKILMAALYIRVSTEKQEELSPDSQKRLLLDYAKSHDMIVSEKHIYIDHRAGLDRPDLGVALQPRRMADLRGHHH